MALSPQPVWSGGWEVLCGRLGVGILTGGGADPQWRCRLSQCGVGGGRCCVGGWGWGVGVLTGGEADPQWRCSLSQCGVGGGRLGVGGGEWGY